MHNSFKSVFEFAGSKEDCVSPRGAVRLALWDEDIVRPILFNDDVETKYIKTYIDETKGKIPFVWGSDNLTTDNWSRGITAANGIINDKLVRVAVTRQPRATRSDLEACIGTESTVLNLFNGLKNGEIKIFLLYFHIDTRNNKVKCYANWLDSSQEMDVEYGQKHVRIILRTPNRKWKTVKSWEDVKNLLPKFPAEIIVG